MSNAVCLPEPPAGRGNNAINKIFLWLLCVVAVCLPRGYGVQAKDLRADQRTTNQLARYYYNQVEQTTSSLVDAQEHLQVIRDRLSCYFDNSEYTARINNCNGPYVKKIVFLARQSLTARPALGDFVRTINVCPVLYNMCMGKQNNVEQCILFERRCIDYVLDEYWRGNWEHTLKEME